MKSMKFAILALLGLSLMFVSCAKSRKAGGMMDDPQTHTIQGMKYWDKGDYTRASDEFKLAISLETGKKYGPAWAGLAMADAAEGKFKEAEDEADKAISYCEKDKKEYQGEMAAAIVIEFQHKGDTENPDWWKDAEDHYEDALKIDPQSGEVYFRMGHMYKIGYEFRKAEDAFKKNLEVKNGYEEQANQEWAVVQKILRAEPGTRVGKKIALVEQITRADIAALFMAELELDRILDKSKVKTYDTDFSAPTDPREMATDTLKKMADIVDCDHHWARNFITDVQNYRIRGLEPSPDHKFNPDQTITRAEYAFFIEDILMAITGDRTLATKYIGSNESRFPDVNPSSPFYNAICNAVDKNIMDAALDGTFHPGD
ncbi:MAG TPA: S-layer homology domain-containing protein, partial [Fibrobacteraceae bacterium]|nr:S-layer homology domain-containing protein [Fibrobacteraceae bacterium]